MECGDQMSALFDQYRIAVVLGQYLHAGPGAANNRRADKHRFEIARAGALLEIAFGMNRRHAAVDLATVRVALDGQVQETEALLRGMFHFLRDQDSARARAEHGLLARERAQRLPETHEIDQLEHG